MRDWAYYSFVVRERPDGTPWVSVATPDDQVVAAEPRSNLGDASVALRLNLCATYGDAKEIADFLNRKLHILKISRPQMAYQGNPA